MLQKSGISAENYVGGERMLPEPIPPLTEEQWATVVKELKRKPSKADIERIKRAKETFKNCRL